MPVEKKRETDQSILWRRLDQPGHESARLFFQDSLWHLTGTAVFTHHQQPCRLDYLVVCNASNREKLIKHKQYVTKHGDDMPEVADWRWGAKAPAGARDTSTAGDNV